MKFALLMLVFLVIATDDVLSQTPPLCGCNPIIIDPVCSSFGVTFQNRCFMGCSDHYFRCYGPCPCRF